VTDWPSWFITPAWVRSETVAPGWLNSSLKPEMTWTKAPLEVLSSLTEPPGD
jgi:hypothetical protein